jgi:hypothetical protein
MEILPARQGSLRKSPSVSSHPIDTARIEAVISRKYNEVVAAVMKVFKVSRNTLHINSQEGAKYSEAQRALFYFLARPPIDDEKIHRLRLTLNLSSEEPLRDAVGWCEKLRGSTFVTLSASDKEFFAQLNRVEEVLTEKK